MKTYAALFRAVNVGGRTCKMAELKQLHESLGFQDVTTIVQTGNVVFRCSEADPDHLAQRIEGAFKQHFGYHSDVMIRTRRDLEAVVAHQPFGQVIQEAPNRVVVVFFKSPPNRAGEDALRSAYEGPEEMKFIGREGFIHYLNGIGVSRLTNTLIEKKLQLVGTARNWNTVLKVLEAAQKMNAL